MQPAIVSLMEELEAMELVQPSVWSLQRNARFWKACAQAHRDEEKEHQP